MLRPQFVHPFDQGPEFVVNVRASLADRESQSILVSDGDFELGDVASSGAECAAPKLLESATRYR